LSAELGDTDFVRAILDASWAEPKPADERIATARNFLLVDREEAIRRAESVQIDDEDARQALAKFWEAANPPVETAERLAETEEAIERDRRSGSYEERLIELAEAYVRIGAFDDARRVVARYDERDRPRRREGNNDLRLDAAYLTLAKIMLDANDPARAIKLVHDICHVGRKSQKPERIALAARAFGVFGERDEAARLAESVASDDSDILVDLVHAWIAIDRARSYDRARTSVDRVTERARRAAALRALAGYAFRIDERGHVPLADDAPQPPPRARLLDGGSLVPAPRVRLR
jgi:tetratricopeptide (TPR) repeat protein